MGEIQWGLAVPPNIGETFLNGFNRGQAMAKEKRTNNALAQFATNPDDPQAVNALIAVDPRLGLQAKQQQQLQAIAQREQADKLRKRQLIPLAAKGDPNAQLELLGIDYETANKLDERAKKQALDGAKYVADAAFDIVQRPPEQRAAAWDAYIDQGAAQFPNLLQFKGKYTPEALQGLVAQAGQMKEWQTFQQPHYTPVGEGGLAGFQYGKPIEKGGQPQNFGPAAGGQGGVTSKVVGGKTYYQTPDGKWHDDMPGGAGSGQPGFQ